MTNDKSQMIPPPAGSRSIIYNMVIGTNESLKSKSGKTKFGIWILTFIWILSFGFCHSRASALDLSSSSTGFQQLSTVLGGLSFGYAKVGAQEVANLAWHPEFKLGPWGMGLDVNIPAGQNKPFGYENLVLRFVEFDDGKKGLRYGVLTNVTWGHGLLLNNYSTITSGPIILNNSQLAFRGYIDLDPYIVRAMVTRTSLYAVRLEERVNPWLTLGETVITDTDGVTPVGTTIVQKVTGAGVDATVPLPLNMTGFAEAARLMDHGNGFSTGVKWGSSSFGLSSSFIAAYRMLDKGFVPGYFGVDYESNPVNLASAEAGTNKNGYLAQFNVEAFNLASLALQYEDYYETDASFAGKLTARLNEQTSLSGYYEQPNFVNFRSLDLRDGAVMGGALAYKVNPFTTLVAHYKKAYNAATGQVEESQYYEFQLTL